jgi:hypothetical protein
MQLGATKKMKQDVTYMTNQPTENQNRNIQLYQKEEGSEKIKQEEHKGEEKTKDYQTKDQERLQILQTGMTTGSRK